MKTHTNNFKNELKKFGRVLDSKITFTVDGVDIELGPEELNSIIPIQKGDILKSAMKELDIDCNIEIPVGSKVNYKFGVYVNNRIEYIDFGDYIVYSTNKKEDTMSYEIVCYDYMLRSMTTYNELQTGTFPMTVREYITHLCNDLSLEFADENNQFANSDRIIYNDLYKGLEYTYRDIFDELAQVTASTICINKNNQVEIRYINNTNDTVNGEYLKDINVNFGEKYGPINSIVISRASESDSVYLQDERSIEENGLCEVKIKENQIMNFNDRSDYLEDILDTLNGLEYYINDFTSTGICYYDLCDRYNVEIDDNTYSCVLFNDEIEITQGLKETIYTEKPIDGVTDYTKADKTDRKINQAYIIVDKQNQKIEAVVSEIGDRTGKTTTITADIDEINSKIETLADITTTGEGVGQITIDKILANQIILLDVYPTKRDILANFASPLLKASRDLKAISRLITFESEEYTIQYMLPRNLLFYNKYIYDEFIQDNVEEKCYVIHRVGVDEQGNKYQLDEEYVEEIENYIPIILKDAEQYRISMQSYKDAHIKVTAMVQNSFTTQFATNVELRSQIKQTTDSITSTVYKNFSTKEETKSEIKQTADAISTEVSKKVGEDEVISKINQSSEEIGISAKKIKLEGYLSANNGFIVDEEGNMICNNGTFNGVINGGKISVVGNDTQDDPYITLVSPEYTDRYPVQTDIWSTGISVIDYRDGAEPCIRTEVEGGFAQLIGNEVEAFDFVPVSLESEKTNFEEFKDGLELIMNSDLYRYTYKRQGENAKKHIGLVIPDEGGDFKTPDEVITEKGNGIDMYSMISIAWASIKQQQQQIEELKNEIKKLKGDD